MTYNIVWILAFEHVPFHGGSTTSYLCLFATCFAGQRAPWAIFQFKTSASRTFCFHCHKLAAEPWSGAFPRLRAMELPGDWTPNLVRQSRGSLAFGDARAAAELSFPRRAGAPPPDLPVGCEVFELDSGCSEVETSSAEARRRLATTAQFYNEMESDTSLFETAADRRFAERLLESSHASEGDQPRQGVAGLHAPGSLKKPEHGRQKVIPNGDGSHGKGGRAADLRDRPSKEFQRESGQANFDFYTDSKNDKYQRQKEVPGPSSGPRRQMFACVTCGNTTHVEDISGLWICSTCRKMRPPDTSRPSKHETPTGTWMYMPHPPSHPGASGPLRGHLVWHPMKAVPRQDPGEERDMVDHQQMMDY